MAKYVRQRVNRNPITAKHPLVQKKINESDLDRYVRTSVHYPKHLRWNYFHDWNSLLMTEKGRGYVRRTSRHKCILIIPRSRRKGYHLNDHPSTI